MGIGARQGSYSRRRAGRTTRADVTEMRRSSRSQHISVFLLRTPRLGNKHSELILMTQVGNPCQFIRWTTKGISKITNLRWTQKMWREIGLLLLSSVSLQRISACLLAHQHVGAPRADRLSGCTRFGGVRACGNVWMNEWNQLCFKI